jgi:cysteinyl-tRNA synthetase
LRLYNTLTRSDSEIQAQAGKTLTFYACGVTVYDHSHIGHARSIVIFDVLRRYLSHKGFKIKFVQNFTDVDDKIIMKARELGIPAGEVAEKFIEQYNQDFTALNVQPPDVAPRATSHITEMIKVIETLIERSLAYVTPTGVYYAVKNFKNYGKLSGKTLDELLAGARVEVDPTKRDLLDFALWKLSNEEPNWPSPWGKGRPGWHIECSAMVMRHLGETIDIHAGGQDLIFPHHENEIAQSEGYTGKSLSKIWMHVGLLTLKREKMSKSIGNIITAKKALERWGPNALRLLAISSHYRNPLNFSEDIMDKMQEMWRLIENAHWELASAHGDQEAIPDAEAEAASAMKDFEDSLANDLNTPTALSGFMRYVRRINQMASEGVLSNSSSNIIQPVFSKIMWILGLIISEVDKQQAEIINMKVQLRNRLRMEKKFAEADKIRNELRAAHIELTDHPNRTVWRKIT